jgi:hypothetical protein
LNCSLSLIQTDFSQSLYIKDSFHPVFLKDQPRVLFYLRRSVKSRRMSSDIRVKGSKKSQYQKKYLYTYSFNDEEAGSEDSLDDYNELEAEFEQPKGRRNAKKSPVTNKKRKQSADFFY